MKIGVCTNNPLGIKSYQKLSFWVMVWAWQGHFEHFAMKNEMIITICIKIMFGKSPSLNPFTCQYSDIVIVSSTGNRNDKICHVSYFQELLLQILSEQLQMRSFQKLSFSDNGVGVAGWSILSILSWTTISDNFIVHCSICTKLHRFDRGPSLNCSPGAQFHIHGWNLVDICIISIPAKKSLFYCNWLNPFVVNVW